MEDLLVEAGVETEETAAWLDEASSADIEPEEGADESAARPVLQPLKPITSTAMAVVHTICGRRKKEVDTVRYVGIVSSPNARGNYVGSGVPLLHRDS